MRAFLLAVSVAVSALPASLAAQESTVASGDGVILRGLDKVSGETTELTIAVGDSLSFGRMEISLISCRYLIEDPAAEAYAFLEITDELRGERLFYGWMVASSPALNALDHARYDVWVMGCQ